MSTNYRLLINCRVSIIQPFSHSSLPGESHVLKCVWTFSHSICLFLISVFPAVFTRRSSGFRGASLWPSAWSSSIQWCRSVNSTLTPSFTGHMITLCSVILLLEEAYWHGRFTVCNEEAKCFSDIVVWCFMGIFWCILISVGTWMTAITTQSLSCSVTSSQRGAHGKSSAMSPWWSWWKRKSRTGGRSSNIRHLDLIQSVYNTLIMLYYVESNWCRWLEINNF